MTRLFAPALTALALLAAPVQALDVSSMTETERAAFRAEVRAYLLENPEVILEAINVLEDRQAAAETQADFDLVMQNAEALFDDGFSWVGGNPEGDITLVEFIDYRCPYCRRAMLEVKSLLAADGNIRLIRKELPILGDDSMQASRFAIATKTIAGMEAYGLIHDALMDYHGELSEVALRRLSDAFDLDSDAIIAEMDSDATTSQIARTHALAQRMKISGTPTFVLQDEMLRGFLPAEQLAIIVAEKRDKN